MAPQSTQILRRNAAYIEKAMAEKFSKSEMAAHELLTTPDRRREKRIFKVASQVALEYASQMHWSNFHTWESFRHITTEEQAPSHAPHFWESIYPFSTCLGMASTVTTALKNALLQDDDIAEYADSVQLVTNRTVDALKQSRRFHCITIVRFWDHCIVIDLVAQPTAFKVALTSIYMCQDSLSFLETSTSCFAYAYLGTSPDGAAEPSHILVEYTGKPDYFIYSEAPFTDMQDGVLGGVLNYAFPAAKTKRHTPLGDMPSRRTIQARSVWDYRPTNAFTTYTPLADGKFLVETVVLRIDIIEQQLILQLPYIDWLAKPDNLHFLEIMECYKGFKRCAESLQDAVAYLYVPLGTPGSTLDLPTKGLSQGATRAVQVVDEVCTALGLPEGEIVRIVNVVADFWKEALALHQDRLVLNEAWDRAIVRDREDSTIDEDEIRVDSAIDEQQVPDHWIV